MQTLTTNRTENRIAPLPNCLGCTDCKGICLQLLELRSVPDMVLHRSAQTP